jgi:hypothetical protein
MKISIPSFLLVVAVKGNKVPALRGELTVTSDGTDGFGTLTCPIFQLQGACIRYGSHNDPQGMVCGNDGEANEAYCNYINYSTDAVACKFIYSLLCVPLRCAVLVTLVKLTMCELKLRDGSVHTVTLSLFLSASEMCNCV